MEKIVAILNLTPDSFSDGYLGLEISAIYEKIEKMIEEGAAVIDIGAESTRPRAKPLSHQEEWRRLEPYIEQIIKKFKDRVEISIDTRHPETAEKVIELGCDWINNVANLDSEEMIELVKDSGVKVVMMHSLSVPADPDRILADDIDPVDHIISWATQKLSELEQQNIAREKIIFDPGIGFGKSANQSLHIIKNVKKFKTLGLPIMIGHSRKSFMKMFRDKPASERDFETGIISAFLQQQEIDYIRVHNPMLNSLALKIFKELN